MKNTAIALPVLQRIQGSGPYVNRKILRNRWRPNNITERIICTENNSLTKTR